MKFKSAFAALSLASVALAGCTTTEETTANAQSRWVGQPADVFFAAYGPPRSNYPLNNGGTLYTWRGGEKEVPVAKPRNSMFKKPPQQTTFNRGFSKTTTKVTHMSPGMIKTTTKSSSGSASINVDKLLNTLANGGRAPKPEMRRVYCEMQISTDANDVITSLHNTGDTAGAGFSLSRCAEILK